MAKKRARRKARKVKARGRISVRVAHLKGLSDKQVSDLLKKAKTAKVGFVILNAPFKVRPVEPVS
jgi:hypothetical protein